VTSAVGGNHLPESLSGPCRCLRYHELTTHKVTKSQKCAAAAAPAGGPARKEERGREESETGRQQPSHHRGVERENEGRDPSRANST
jgi:hypothetical protein